MSESLLNLERFRSNIERTVFGVSCGIVVIALLVLSIQPEAVSGAIEGVNEFLWTNLEWFYLVTMFVLVLFCAAVFISPWGSKRLGTEEPEFGFGAYLAMLFSAGIAAGIVFWGPAEALFHFDTVPPFIGAESQSSAAAVGALQYTLFHWGFTAWSAYVVIALPIAYYGYTRGLPIRVSNILVPLIGAENLDGPLGKTVDILAIFATLGGLATTTGLVAQQFLSGISYQFNVSVGILGTVLLIGVLTIVCTISAATGLRRGIRRISILNVTLFALFGLAVFTLGPTGTIGSLGIQGITGYAVGFVPMSLYTGGGEWASAWTLFYWAWWLSWAPFVGLFFARISRGRTVRQLIGAGLIAPALGTIVWFVIMGATAIEFQQTGRADILAAVFEQGEAVSGYPLLEALPFGAVLSVLFLGVIITFLVTSADSAIYSLGLLSSKRDRTPTLESRVFWGVFQGVIATVLIIVGGEAALQNAAILVGTPFAVIALLAIVGMSLEFGWRPGGLAATDESPEEPAVAQSPTED